MHFSLSLRVSSAVSTENSASMRETLQSSLVTELSQSECFIIQPDSAYPQKKHGKVLVRKRANEHPSSDSVVNRKITPDQHSPISTTTDRQIEAERWTRTFLQKMGSSGVIHSTNTGRNGRLIICNVRNMGNCQEIHEDYFNDSTVYMNLVEKQFSVRCNRIPCTRKPWKWEGMNDMN